MIPFFVLSGAACYFLFQTAIQLRRIREDTEVYTDAVVRVAGIISRLQTNIDNLSSRQERAVKSLQEVITALEKLKGDVSIVPPSVVGDDTVDTIVTETDNEVE